MLTLSADARGVQPMGTRSTFLFAQPSPTSGAARTLDMGATFDSYNTSETDQQADMQALFNDWCAVGDELAAVLFKSSPD